MADRPTRRQHLRDAAIFRTLRFRLTASFASVVALVLAATGVLIYVQFSRDLDHRIDDDLGDRQTVIVGLSRTSTPTQVLDLAGEPFAQIYDATGRVVAASRDLAGAPILSAAELARARRAPLITTHEDLPHSRGDGGRLRAFAVAHGGVAVIAEPLEDRELSLHRLALLLILTLPGALLLASLAGHQVARGALLPVERMRARAAGIGAGDPTQRLPEPGTRDELDRLAVTLNDLLDRLDHALVRERRIVGDASHELRTPIAVLRTRIDVALRGDDDPARLRAVLIETRADAERLSRLADDLLVLARADQGELPLRPEPLDVQDLLEHAVARHTAPAADAGRALAADNRIDGGAVVLADPDRTAQALDNLIVNALRYGDGAVEVRAALVPATTTGAGGAPADAAPHGHTDPVPGERPSGVVELSIRDHGDGFPDAFLPVAFQRFSQADNAHGGGGSGLGLAIVDALARAQGGTASVRNDPAGGAVGAITLPLA